MADLETTGVQIGENIPITPTKEAVAETPPPPNVAELQTLVTTESFRRNFLEIQSSEEREEQKNLKKQMRREAEVSIGRMIPEMAGQEIGVHPDEVKGLKNEMQAIRNERQNGGPSGNIEERLGMPEADAEALVARWEAAVKKAVQATRDDRENMIAGIESKLAADPEKKKQLEEAELKVVVSEGRNEKRLDNLIAQIGERQNDPDFVDALDAWGRSPNSSGDLGPDGQGYNAGITHFWEYRANKAKNGRYQDDDISVDAFIKYTKEIQDLLQNPDPKNNSNVATSRVLEDDEGQLRLYVLDNDRQKIVAFARPDESKPKIITVIPGQKETDIESSVQKEISGETEGRLNRLANGAKEVGYEALANRVQLSE